MPWYGSVKAWSWVSRISFVLVIRLTPIVIDPSMVAMIPAIQENVHIFDWSASRHHVTILEI
jgi:hypothetical protein